MYKRRNAALDGASYCYGGCRNAPLCNAPLLPVPERPHVGRRGTQRDAAEHLHKSSPIRVVNAKGGKSQ